MTTGLSKLMSPKCLLPGVSLRPVLKPQGHPTGAQNMCLHVKESSESAKCWKGGLITLLLC